MAEEQQLQESHRLCANNCGFFGSPATMNLCSKCFRDRHLKEEQQRQTQAPTAGKNSLPFPVSSSSSLVAAAEVTGPSAVTAFPAALFSLADAAEAAEEKKAKAVVPGPNRCASCQKRVGLTGFQCRCGATFCGAHRLAEQHGCAFDFKAAGREAIARANPVVRADKLQKI